ncbi:hypothetical protein F3J28_12865 [Enterobacter sp. Ap-1006]|uniref:winged helix-turn-helix domain-containing protein n=1 Tax=Enterobacter sp. Ap-1006 TaxID=2608345 RepID=UPI0014241A23|nr:winged helix-turn-helix domain-containing protein [Enterobacter sp. Ap-1006]NIF48655.1 hypothetical protein [Enterobacter sp. Ap-1006]
MIVFLIENNIEFRPGDRTLRGQNKEVKLHSSSVHCLELLIERQGDVVDHESLHDFAWRRFGMEVGSNALYQSISTLRKAFSVCGGEEAFIRTVPRRGFMLPQKILVSSQSLGPDPTDKKAAEDVQNENLQLRIESASDNTSERNEQQKDNVGPQIKNTLSILDNVKMKTLSGKNHFLIIGFFVFSCCLAALYSLLLSVPTDYPKRLQYNGCDFRSNEASDDDMIEDITLKLNIKCSTRKHLYVTSYQEGSVISVIQCARPITFFSHPNCISTYYTEKP